MIKKTFTHSNLVLKTVIEPTNDKEEYIAIATLSTPDNEGEIFLSAGADLSYIEKNKVMFLDHEYSTNTVIGYIRSFKKYPSKDNHQGWEVRFGFVDDPLALKIKKIIDETGSYGVSIGALPIDAGPLSVEERRLYDPEGKAKTIYRKWKWVELSLTPIPAHSDARAFKDIQKYRKYLDDNDLLLLGYKQSVKKQLVVTEDGTYIIKNKFLEKVNSKL